MVRLIPQRTWLGTEFGISVEDLLEMLPVRSAPEAAVGGTQRPGQAARTEGLRAHHPVVMIPGIVSSGLELWGGHECAKSYFRQRLWGTTSMFRLFMMDKDCWVRHMSLNATTAADPPGVKVRAAQGFEAADYLVGGYWVWAPLIENLADLGYEASNMWMAAYDWRLPFDRP